MKITILLVTRNKSLTVKTLHTMLKFNIICLQLKHQVEILFVNDDPDEINAVITRSLKNSERMIFVDYSIYVDEESLKVMTLNDWPQGYQGVVFPCVTEGIDWDLFRKKIQSGSEEPVSQMGLNFDTEVSKEIKEGFWSVTSTQPKVWVLNCKSVVKSLKEKKGEGIKVPMKREELFHKLKVCAFTKARVVATYTHECLGNILETAGVTSYSL